MRLFAARRCVKLLNFVFSACSSYSCMVACSSYKKCITKQMNSILNITALVGVIMLLSVRSLRVPLRSSSSRCLNIVEKVNFVAFYFIKESNPK